MIGPSGQQVGAALDTICDPCSLATGTPLGLREMGLVRDWRFDDGTLHVTICLTGPGCTYFGLLAQGIRAALGELPGVQQVEVELDPSVVWTEQLMPPAARAKLAQAREARFEAMRR